MNKTERQSITVEKWITGGKKGIFQACPRFGKTKTAIKIIRESIVKDSNVTLIIVVPSEIIKQQWIEESKKFENVNCLHELIESNIFTSYSLINRYKEGSLVLPYLLIIDEIHRYFTQGSHEIRDVLSNISFTNCLCLTGIDIKNALPNSVINYFGGVLDVITEQEALEKEWISPYTEYNIPLDLSENDKNRYANFSKPIWDTLQSFKGMSKRLNNQLRNNFFKDDLQVIFACYTGVKYKGDYIQGYKIRELVAAIMGWRKDLNPQYSNNEMVILHWNPDNIYNRCKDFKTFLYKRNEIILHNRIKIEAVMKIIELNPVPTIIFNDSTNMVDEISDSLRGDAIAYHSNIKSRPIWSNLDNDYIRYATGKNEGKPRMFGAKNLKKMAIEGMRIGRYKYLVTARALDEGLDLPAIEQIITTSGSTNPIQYFQRTSRGKTINPEDKFKNTLIFNLYFRNFYNKKAELIQSRDEQKLKLRQRSLDTFPMQLNSLSQLQYLFT